MTPEQIRHEELRTKIGCIQFMVFLIFIIVLINLIFF